MRLSGPAVAGLFSLGTASAALADPTPEAEQAQVCSAPQPNEIDFNRYAHLNSFSVSAGQTVTQGQKIGAVGKTRRPGNNGKAGSSVYNSPSEHCGS